MSCKHEPMLLTNPQQSDRAIHILVAYDHVTSRLLFIEMLAEAFPMAHFCEAGDGDEVLVKLRQHAIDLLLLDVNMPRRTGLEILPDVRALSPNTRVIVQSVSAGDMYATFALGAGAHAYLEKDRLTEELISTVQSIMSTGPAEKSGPVTAQTR
jgi:two-component system, NarL family, invasion response regulator UvrY